MLFGRSPVLLGLPECTKRGDAVRVTIAAAGRSMQKSASCASKHSQPFRSRRVGRPRLASRGFCLPAEGQSVERRPDTFLMSYPRAPRQWAQASHRASCCCLDRRRERGQRFLPGPGCSVRCTATTSATCRPTGPGSERRPTTLRPSATYGARRSGERTRGRCRRPRASRCRWSARVLGLGSWRSR